MIITLSLAIAGSFFRLLWAARCIGVLRVFVAPGIAVSLRRAGGAARSARIISAVGVSFAVRVPPGIRVSFAARILPGVGVLFAVGVPPGVRVSFAIRVSSAVRISPGIGIVRPVMALSLGKLNHA